MDITKKADGAELTVIPVGRLDSACSGEFDDFISREFSSGYDMLTLDFENVDYISSKGLRILLSIYKSLNGRKMRIVGANTSVKEILWITKLAETFCVE